MIEIFFPTQEAVFERWACFALIDARCNWIDERGFHYQDTELAPGGYSEIPFTEQWIYTVSLP